MNKPKFFAFALLLICFSSFSNSSFAQTENNQSEPSYEVILQILIASNNSTAKSGIYAKLSETINKFRNDFPYSDYRLISSNFQRIENKGNINYRGLINDLSPAAGQDIAPEAWAFEIAALDLYGQAPAALGQIVQLQARLLEG